MVKWYEFTAVKDGREVLEKIPSRTWEAATAELHKLGYTDLCLVGYHVVRDYSETSELI